MMTLEKLINILAIKEKSILCYIDLYGSTFDDMKDLQHSIDQYASNVADDFLKEYGQYFENDSLLTFQLITYLLAVGADKKHSGKRVCEALYQKFSNPKDSTDDTESTR